MILVIGMDAKGILHMSSIRGCEKRARCAKMGEGRDECILRLRCIFVNGQWSESVKVVEQ
jgi:hypothetical protein